MASEVPHPDGIGDFLGTVLDEFGDLRAYRHADGSVVLWSPDAEWSTTFTPEQRDKLRELLDRAAMPGQRGGGGGEPGAAGAGHG